MPIITKEYWTGEKRNLLGKLKNTNGWSTVDLNDESGRNSFREKLNNFADDAEKIQSFFVPFTVESTKIQKTGLQCFLERIPSNWLSTFVGKQYLDIFFKNTIEWALKNPALTSPSDIIKIIYNTTMDKGAKKYLLDQALACFLSNAHIYECQEVEAIYTLFFNAIEDNNFFLEVFFSLPKDVKRLASVHFFEKVPEDQKDNQALLFFKAFSRYELALNTQNFARLLRLSEAMQTRPKDFQILFSEGTTDNLQIITLELLESMMFWICDVTDEENQTEVSDEQKERGDEAQESAFTSRASLTSRRSVPNFNALDKLPKKASSRMPVISPVQHMHRQPVEPLKLFDVDGELLPLLKEMSLEVLCYNVLNNADKIYPEEINKLFALDEAVFFGVYSNLEPVQKQKIWENFPFEGEDSQSINNTLSFFLMLYRSLLENESTELNTEKKTTNLNERKVILNNMIKSLLPSIIEGIISNQLRINELVNFLKILDYCIGTIEKAKQLYFKKAILLKIQTLLESAPVDNKKKIIADISQNTTLCQFLVCYASQLDSTLFSRKELTDMNTLIRQIRKSNASKSTFSDLSITILVNHAQAENSLLDRIIRYTSKPFKKQSNSGTLIDQGIKKLSEQPFDRTQDIPGPLSLPLDYLDTSRLFSRINSMESADSSVSSFKRPDSQLSGSINEENASSSSISSPPESPAASTDRKSFRTWGRPHSISSGTLEENDSISPVLGSSPVASASHVRGITYGLTQSSWGTTFKKVDDLSPVSSGKLSPKLG